MNRLRTCALGILLASASVPALAQARAAPPEAPLRRGSTEIAVIAGTALPVTWLRAHSDRRTTMASLDIGRMLTNPIGSGPLSGQFEMLIEVTPLIVVHQPVRAFGVTASPLHLRWNLGPRASSRWRPFAEASGGVVVTSADVPARTTTFNFIDQAGFGIRIGGAGCCAWLAGYRFQHISNAGRVKPNPGANFNFVYIGVAHVR